VTLATKIAVPLPANLPAMAQSVEPPQELVILRKYAVAQQQLALQTLLLLMEPPVATQAPSPALQANAHPATSNAKLSWDHTRKETTPMPALLLAVKSPAPPLNSAPTSAIPCNKTSWTEHPAKVEVAVPTVNVQVPQSEKKSHPGSVRIER